MHFRGSLKKSKRAVVSFSKVCRSKTSQYNFIDTFRIFDNSHLKFEKIKKAKNKK